MATTLRRVLVCSIMFCVAAAAGTASALPPWQSLISLRRVEADPNKEYTISEKNGPWMILAATFSAKQKDDAPRPRGGAPGAAAITTSDQAGAEAQARALALELRKRYKLPAYVHKMKFDFGQAQGRGISPQGEPLKMRYQRDDAEELAVLVGNYATVDDAGAQRTLNLLKFAEPDSLRGAADRRDYQQFGALRLMQKTILASDNEKKKKGPMGHAFVIANPLIPKEYFAPRGLDPLVIKMNKHVPHSLLDCPGTYTVQVATFGGSVVMDQKKVKEIQDGQRGLGSKLADAADKAHRLTEALRAQGVEAYEFHDISASLVTIGSFDSLGTPRADGKIEIHPRIHALLQQYGSAPQAAAAPGAPNRTPARSLAGIPFDPQPKPVMVPKKSFAADYDVTSNR